MRIQHLLESKISISDHRKNFTEMFRKFLPLAMSILKIDNLPEMKFEGILNSESQPSFGMYAVGDRVLYVSLLNRHPNDILRTVAHELVHYAQDINNELTNTSGETGSPHENQANQLAGVIMRTFNKQYPEYLKSTPL